MNKEIKSLTGVRGIAASWVVLLHFLYVPGLKTTNPFLEGLNTFLLKGNMGVDMFFLLSAFVMCLAYQHIFSQKVKGQDYIDFFKKRFVRIYPAYLFWLLLFTVSFKMFNIPVFIVNALLIQNFFNPDNYTINAVFWSLSTEWVMYALFPILIILFHKLYNKLNYYIVLLIIIISLIGMYLLPNFDIYYILGSKPLTQHSITVGINSYVRCFFDYVIGISIFFLSRKDLFSKVFANRKMLSLYIFAVILLLSFFRNTEIIIIVGFAVLILSLYFNNHSKSIFNSKIVYLLGLISYSMYLLHPLLRFLVTVFAMKVFHLPVEAVDFYSMLIALVLVVPSAYISYIIIEKKGGDLIRPLLFKKKQVNAY